MAVFPKIIAGTAAFTPTKARYPNATMPMAIRAGRARRVASNESRRRNQVAKRVPAAAASVTAATSPMTDFMRGIVYLPPWTTVIT